MHIVWQNGTYPLGERVQIGRADDNDIVISDPAVSVYHCAIVQLDEDFYLHDLSSTNGTFVNGEQIKGHFLLHPGDVVTVGPRIFMIENRSSRGT